MPHEHSLSCLEERSGRLTCKVTEQRLHVGEEETSKSVKKLLTSLNEKLHTIGYNIYYRSATEALQRIHDALDAHEIFYDSYQHHADDMKRKPSGHFVLAIRKGKWEGGVSVSWHQMPSGRYEIVTYAS